MSGENIRSSSMTGNCRLWKSDDVDSCSICLDPYNEESRIHKLPCNHIFHCECINKVVETEMNSQNVFRCPLCRWTPPGQEQKPQNPTVEILTDLSIDIDQILQIQRVRYSPEPILRLPELMANGIFNYRLLNEYFQLVRTKTIQEQQRYIMDLTGSIFSYVFFISQIAPLAQQLSAQSLDFSLDLIYGYLEGKIIRTYLEIYIPQSHPAFQFVLVISHIFETNRDIIAPILNLLYVPLLLGHMLESQS